MKRVVKIHILENLVKKPDEMRNLRDFSISTK